MTGGWAVSGNSAVYYAGFAYLTVYLLNMSSSVSFSYFAFVTGVIHCPGSFADYLLL